MSALSRLPEPVSGRLTRADQRGFTLIELLVVAVVGSLLLVIAYGTMASNQRVTTQQAAQVQSQQTVRSGYGILVAELREVSGGGADLIGLGSDTVRVRSMRKFGIACDVDYSGSPPTLTLMRVGDWFEQGDSVFVFADGVTSIASDDVWLRGVAGTVDTTATCATGQAAQMIQLPDLAAAMAVDSVRIGAPVRNYSHYTYGLHQVGSDWFLGRREAGTSWVPMVGPMSSPTDGGLDLVYRDEFGAITPDPARVRQIDLTVRTASEVRSVSGAMVGDSITTRIFLRN